MSREPTTLLDVIHVIRQLADKLEAMAETMTEREVQTFEQVYPPEEGNTEAVQKPVSVKDTPTVSISEIRAVLAEKSRSGFTDSVKALLQKHGASKLSGVSPEEYAVRGGEADWNLTIMKTVYTQCFLLHPVLVGWRVRHPHSFVLPCRIP